MFVSLYSLGLLAISILSIRVGLQTKKPKWYWPLVAVERPLLFAGLALIAFRVENSLLRDLWVYVSWFLMGAFLAESYYDVITFEARDYDLGGQETTKRQEMVSLCVGIVVSVAVAFPGYAMNVAWAYGYM